MSKTLSASVFAAAAFLSSCHSSPDTSAETVSSDATPVARTAPPHSKPAVEIPALRLVSVFQRNFASLFLGEDPGSPVMIFADPDGKRYRFDCPQLEERFGLKLAEQVQNPDKRTYNATRLQIEEFQNAKSYCPQILV